MSTAELGRSSVHGWYGRHRWYGGGDQETCTWGLASPAAYSVGSIPGDVVAGDFDGDGALDLAVASSNDVRVLVNRRDGTFLSYVAYNGGDWPVSLSLCSKDYALRIYALSVSGTNTTNIAKVTNNANQKSAPIVP